MPRTIGRIDYYSPSQEQRWRLCLVVGVLLSRANGFLLLDSSSSTSSSPSFKFKNKSTRINTRWSLLGPHESIRRRGPTKNNALSMVLTPSRTSQQQLFMTDRGTTQSAAVEASIDFSEQATKRKVRRKYKRKRIPETEQELRSLRAEMQREYEKLCRNGKPASLWSFESLFPDPVWDELSVRRDLFEVRERDSKTQNNRNNRKGRGASAAVGATTTTLPTTNTTTSKTTPTKTTTATTTTTTPMVSTASSSTPGKMRTSFYGGSAMMRIWREKRMSPPDELTKQGTMLDEAKDSVVKRSTRLDPNAVVAEIIRANRNNNNNNNTTMAAATTVTAVTTTNATSTNGTTVRVDRDLTRMVEDRIYGYRRTPAGDFQYDTSLMGDGAVKFRDGVRLGNPLRINADRLNYSARKELQHGKIEEAQEMYEQAIRIDPRDGRAYLGISRCAERRHDFKLAREVLRTGIANSVSLGKDGITPDRGANPFLLQTLGCLEEKMGNLAQAEALYTAAAKSRPTHAAAWVALARLRTTKLGQSAQVGRACYQTAERELRQAGLPPSSHVYTAWASLEYHKAGDVRRARELFKKALEVDPRCSAAYLQLGVMEADNGNWDAAQECFDEVLKFDQRNSRVLQAYALSETKKPDGSSRKAIGLFERAIKANPRDAGVLQPYALYVAELGDVDAARTLLRRGTEMNKRDPSVWQAWGVLETRMGDPAEARRIFQQGIWACAQLTGVQSGGYRCARLWQAWGVLEAREGDHAAARRCFSRALDADSRNIPAISAWANMEVELGNISDARSIYERALGKFSPGCSEKTSLWRNYEVMEERLGHATEAQRVFQRAMREALAVVDEDPSTNQQQKKQSKTVSKKGTKLNKELSRTADEEVEVVRWNGLGGEVWLNDRAIESKVPGYGNKRKSKKIDL